MCVDVVEGAGGWEAAVLLLLLLALLAAVSLVRDSVPAGKAQNRGTIRGLYRVVSGWYAAMHALVYAACVWGLTCALLCLLARASLSTGTLQGAAAWR